MHLWWGGGGGVEQVHNVDYDPVNFNPSLNIRCLPGIEHMLP
jgi:hypothetical protein